MTEPSTDRPPTRIQYLDTLRGFAVLGILAINIIGFGVPYGFSVLPEPGGRSLPNLLAWLVNALLVEGTMRGVFAMLFGAGIIIYTSKAASGGGPSSLELHLRRMLWLIPFGLLNSHVLLWRGDILFEYAVTGLFVVVLRNARPRVLIALAVVGLTFVSARGASGWLHFVDLQQAAESIVAAQEQGRTVSEADQSTLADWEQELEGIRPSAEVIERNTATMLGSFRGMFRYVTEEVTDARTITYYRKGVFETGSMMLLGMALFSLGALAGRWTRQQYFMLALAGYGVGLLTNGTECLAIITSGFDPATIEFSNLVSYQLGRVATAIGHVAAIALWCQSGLLAGIQERLAAVGRMALSNYLAQSVLALIIFTGLGFGLYGALERYELYYVVATMWAAQLLWSKPWLEHFRHGPAEHVWRALVIWRLPKR